MGVARRVKMRMERKCEQRGIGMALMVVGDGLRRRVAGLAYESFCRGRRLSGCALVAQSLLRDSCPNKFRSLDRHAA